jgi:hypothetical protein
LFTPEVSEKLGYYVYRLIDPRNGETFYIGKGRGNRVFNHVAGALGGDSDGESEKLERIRLIHLRGLEVGHVVHRHGMDEATAFQVEAALIDAYPGLANEQAGHGSNDYGPAHTSEIIEQYAAKEAVFHHNVLIINISRTAVEKGVYEAVRGTWKLDPKRARAVDVVLAVLQGLIVGVFMADEWMPAGDRWEFVGRTAPLELVELYLRRRLPESMRPRGAANPIRYVQTGF